ncbi:hypothetical protein CECT5772_10577 [Streptococcus equi subsp. ruminatorum CECT 5772]|uniref:Uncharacterized protein n=1 Tax=Streptococcus equi subsp. ruminatorum CECT 5772 TaxID=1051981 RepID=A0A922T1V1_9STRE|nr:hypothetical protein CECT5772_10577 [Streptococcus equi subsp. ruminatorum CECT 5772]
MKEDKKVVKQVRKKFRSNLKSARMHYRKEVRTLKKLILKKEDFENQPKILFFRKRKQS